MTTLLLAAAVSTFTLAQGAPAAAAPPATDGKAVAIERNPEVEEIGRELRCPVCQGMPIGESPSEMAQAMMKRVRELHAEGKSREYIRQYFVDRYGEWVLLKPEAKGFNLVVWFLPPAALLLGLWAVVVYARRGKKTPDKPATTPAPASQDPYLQRVRELEKGDL